MHFFDFLSIITFLNVYNDLQFCFHLNHVLKRCSCNCDPLCRRIVFQILKILHRQRAVHQGQEGRQLGRVEGGQDLNENPPRGKQDSRAG